MKRFSDRHQLTTLSELNITPLLDLAFVLLVIFMITTPLMETSTDLVVPSSHGTPGATAPTNVETVSVNKNAIVTLNEKPVTLETLEQELTSLKAERPQIAIVVRAHKELPVQNLIDIMDVVKKVGITRIGVVSVSPES